MKKASVYLIEDSALDTYLIQMAILRWKTPTSLTVLRDGIEAISTLSVPSVIPDLVIIDLGLPHIGGLQILKILRNLPHLNGTPIIIYTNSLNEEDREEALNLGADSFFKKQPDWLENAKLVENLENWVMHRNSGDKVQKYHHLDLPSYSNDTGDSATRQN